MLEISFFDDILESEALLKSVQRNYAADNNHSYDVIDIFIVGNGGGRIYFIFVVRAYLILQLYQTLCSINESMSEK